MAYVKKSLVNSVISVLYLVIKNFLRRIIIVQIAKEIAIIIAMLALIVNSAIATEPDLVAAWAFDKGAGDVAEDVTGNGHDGELTNCKWVKGKLGSALEFDGVESQVLIPDEDSLDIEDEVTVEAWINPSGFNALSAVAQKWGDTSNRRQYLLCLVGQNVNFYISGSGDTWPTAGSAGTVSEGEWTHIAGTYDSESIRVYINGELDGETANQEGLFASDIDAWIGGYGPGAEFDQNRHFIGVIDEVRFWKKALTEEEIQDSMSASVSPVEAKDKTAVAWGDLKSM